MMKKGILSLSSLLFSTLLFAQAPIMKDGLYYTVYGELYNGSLTTKYGVDNTSALFQVRNGKLDGQAIFYHADQSIRETGYFKQGKPDGTWESFDKQGRLIAQGNYVYGKKHGKWLIWDEQGVKRYEMTYKSGLKINTWYLWDGQQSLVAQKTYTDQVEQYNRQVFKN